jgi:hypothetical protein
MLNVHLLGMSAHQEDFQEVAMLLVTHVNTTQFYLLLLVNLPLIFLNLMTKFLWNVTLLMIAQCQSFQIAILC